MKTHFQAPDYSGVSSDRMLPLCGSRAKWPRFTRWPPSITCESCQSRVDAFIAALPSAARPAQ